MNPGGPLHIRRRHGAAAHQRTQPRHARLTHIGIQNAAPPQTRRHSQRRSTLASAHLVHQHVQDRYTSHDLLRLYASDRAVQEDPESARRAAVTRLLDWQLATAEAAVSLIYPEMLRLLPPRTPTRRQDIGFPDPQAALAWLDGERPNLVNAARHSAQHGPQPLAWQLADALRTYFWYCGHFMPWHAVARAGLTAAENAGDQLAQAVMHTNIGALSWRQDNYDQAIEHYTTAQRLARQLGHADLEAAALSSLGGVYRQAGQPAQAIESLSRALAYKRREGVAQAPMFGRLGSVYWELGRLREAADHHAQAYARYETMGSRGGQAIALANLGETYYLLGRSDDALDCLNRGLALYRQIENRDGQATTLCCLARAHNDAGRHTRALDLCLSALAVARDLGRTRTISHALGTYAAVQQSAGRFDEAAELYSQALTLARQIGHRYPQAEALVGLASARRHLGQPKPALDLVRQALAITCQAGYRIIECEARETLAEIHLALDQPEPAAAQARRARDLHDQTGYRHPPAIGRGDGSRLESVVK